MKIYITSRFKGSEDNKAQIEELCNAVRNAGIEDFHFIRDIEHYQSNFFDSQKKLWEAAKEQLKVCDALLVDVSDNPSGGRVAEAGMAYALNIPIYVIAKKGTEYKDFYTGIAEKIFEYEELSDITPWLKIFLKHTH